MNINFQRAVDRWAGVPICALFSLVERLRRLFAGEAAVAQPKRILIVLLSEMGSLVLAQPMFAELKRRYPQAELYMLMFAKNREVLDLQGVMPRENVITLNDKALGSFAADSLNALLRMRSLDFDVVIDCELFSRVSSIFSYLSGAKVHVGFEPHTQEGLYRGSFMNRKVMYNPYQHLSQQFLTMVEAIGASGRPIAKRAPGAVGAPPLLQFEQGEVAHEIAQLEKDFTVLSGKKLVLVYPDGGILPIRAWPPEYYKRLCNELLQEGYAVGLIGLPDAKPLAREIVAHCKDELCIDLTGYTRSVRHLLAIFHRAALLVTNDGGPGQFAALTPLPTLVFFGPETPALYSPLAPNIHCLYTSLSCSPCLTAYNHRNSPCDGDNQCLKQIAPEQVLARARELLQESPSA
ncbi:MAG: glycosyltransferase family 9 protein [Gammaproteobacteria bacterium]|nr:glycosyltransferase family 9 protein [Gammaproteobacteria bacterium]MBU1776275.1 glycosyltransferase family 9 protein [Gammaproteobacteria bacterium]MBU1967998.1 glycosyltransferase family 9 protein [Gammaproteobacteria bacterium]